MRRRTGPPGPPRPPVSGARRALLLLGAALSFGLAALGAVLPGLPTTPFLLVTSACLARASPALNERLRRSRLFGGLLRDWEAAHGVRLHVKLTAITFMAGGVVGCWLWADLPPPALTAIGIVAAIGFVVVLRLPLVRD